MTRLAVRSILGTVLAMTLWPAEAQAQRYAYVVRDCLTACVGQQLLVFDATNGTAVTQIELAVTEAGQPTNVPGRKHLAVSPDGRRAYVTFDQAIVVVNLQNNTVLGQFSGVVAPSYPVMSPDGQHLYVLDRTGESTHTVVVINTTTGTATTHALAGVSSPQGLSVTADESTAVMETNFTGIAALTLATGAVRTLDLGTVTGVVVHPDNARAFTVNLGGGLHEIDLTSLTVTRTATIQDQFGFFGGVKISPDGAYLYVGQSGNTLFSGAVHEVATASLMVTRQLGGGGVSSVSPSGLQLATSGTATGTSSFYAILSITSTIDQPSISIGSYEGATQTISGFVIGPDLSCVMSPPSPASATVAYTGGTGTVTVPAPIGCAWTATSNQRFLTITGGQGGNSAGTVSYSVEANPLATARSATITIAGQVTTVTQDPDPNTLSASPTSLRFGAHRNLAGAPYQTTPAQSVTVFATGTATSWTATADQPWVAITYGSGSGAGQFTVGVTESLMHDLTGTQSAIVTITATGHTATVPVTMVIDPSNGYSAPPFGRVDTPTQDASGVTGAFAISGWALDDIGIGVIKVYRNCLQADLDRGTPCSTIGLAYGPLVELGAATIVPGARPDVEAVYPNYPGANRAGWGFMILSNSLPDVPAGQPNGGVGPVEIHVLAFGDYPGVTRLGRTTIDQTPTRLTLANDTIAKPFGAIDRPRQGEAVSGTLNNFGWVLTPDPGTGVLMPADGSTVRVFVDGAVVGTATYDLCRGSVAVGGLAPPGVLCNDDVSTIFRGDGTRFRNLDAGRGPIGLRSIDTMSLTNGLHTLSWGVTDSGNRSEGIGSRYFTVLNSGADACGAECAVRRAQAELPGGRTFGSGGHAVLPLYGRTGFDLQSAYTPLVPNAEGVPQVRIPELGRVELQIPGVTDGALLVNGESRPLPIGVGINRQQGIVTWAAGLGYLGTYRLVFDGTVVDVTVLPASTVAQPLRMHLDSPASGMTSDGRVRVEGWALDPQAWTGSGTGTVHVWARLRSNGSNGTGTGAASPIFLGVADLGIARPDVSAAHGAQFSDAGFRLLTTLPPGEWDVTAYVWVTRTGRFEDARSATVVVK